MVLLGCTVDTEQAPDVPNKVPVVADLPPVEAVSAIPISTPTTIPAAPSTRSLVPTETSKSTPIPTPAPPSTGSLIATKTPVLSPTAVPAISPTPTVNPSPKPLRRSGSKPEDRYGCIIMPDGYCIFTGTPHNAGLEPKTSNIVDRNGVVIFSINEAVAVNSSGKILEAKGTPAFDGDQLIRHNQDAMTDDEKAFHRVMSIMFPIRNALMYDIATTSQNRWNSLVSELEIRSIKDKTFTDGPTPRDNYYGRQGVFELAKNPKGKDIHHDVMKFLEEAGLYFLCHVTSNEFNAMLQDTHPEGHNPCLDSGIIPKVPLH